VARVDKYQFLPRPFQYGLYIPMGNGLRGKYLSVGGKTRVGRHQVIIPAVIVLAVPGDKEQCHIPLARLFQKRKIINYAGPGWRNCRSVGYKAAVHRPVQFPFLGLEHLNYFCGVVYRVVQVLQERIVIAVYAD
jgi:hypothetical protein